MATYNGLYSGPLEGVVDSLENAINDIMDDLDLEGDESSALDEAYTDITDQIDSLAALMDKIESAHKGG